MIQIVENRVICNILWMFAEIICKIKQNGLPNMIRFVDLMVHCFESIWKYENVYNLSSFINNHSIDQLKKILSFNREYNKN